MGSWIKGRVVEVHANYGVVEGMISDHKVRFYFLVLPNMLSEDGSVSFSEAVRFKVRSMPIREVSTKVAFKLTNDGGPIKRWDLNEKILTKRVRKHYDFLFENALDDLELSLALEEALEQLDVGLKDFFIKWILIIEKSVKEGLVRFASDNQISSTTFFRVMRGNSVTRGIIEDRLGKLKNDYIFRLEFSTFKVALNEHDPNDLKVLETPINILLETLTLTELSRVLDAILPVYAKEKLDDDFKFLYYISISLGNLAFVRNAAAHGNPLIPHILDVRYSAGASYDLAEVWPTFNEGGNVEEHPLFSFIRYTTRQLAKMGQAPIHVGSPQSSALLFTKVMLLNPSKKSLFMLLFSILVLESYTGTDGVSEFWEEFAIFVPFRENDSEDETISPVSQQLFLIVLPLLVYKADFSGMFKALLESTVSLPTNEQNLLLR